MNESVAKEEEKMVRLEGHRIERKNPDEAQET